MLKREESKEVGVTVWRCDVCGVVAEESGPHTCDKALLDHNLAWREKELVSIMASLETELPREELLIHIHALDELQQWIWKNREFPLIEQKFTIGVVRSHIQKRLIFLINRVREMNDSCYDNYKKMIKEGVLLDQRRQKIDHKKIAWCKKRESELLELLRRFRVRPFSEWLAQGDFESIKRMGFGEFINLNLENIVYDKEQKA